METNGERREKPALGIGARKTLTALAEAFFSTEAGPPPEARVSWLVRDADDFLAHAGGQARAVYLLALFAVSVLVPLFAQRLTSVSALALPARVSALRRLEKSWAAAPLFATRALLSVLYYEHPDVAREVGFDGA